MEHSMETIARTGSTPMQKQPVPREGTDARMQGNMLANEVMAQVMLVSKGWRGYAMRLINGTTDMRAVFIQAIETALKEMRKANAEATARLNKDGKPDPSKDDTRQAGKRVNSACTAASELRVIARAFNGGATVEGLLAYANTIGRTDNAQLDDVGYAVIVEYARTFSDAKAGRKADPWLVKLGKWLDNNPAPEGDEAAGKQYAKVVALFNELSK